MESGEKDAVDLKSSVVIDGGASSSSNSSTSSPKQSPLAVRPAQVGPVDEWGSSFEEERWEFYRKGTCRSFTRRGTKRAPTGELAESSWASLPLGATAEAGAFLSHAWAANSPPSRRLR